jgi:hypothetical protein
MTFKLSVHHSTVFSITQNFVSIFHFLQVTENSMKRELVEYLHTRVVAEYMCLELGSYSNWILRQYIPMVREFPGLLARNTDSLTHNTNHFSNIWDATHYWVDGARRFTKSSGCAAAKNFAAFVHPKFKQDQNTVHWYNFLKTVTSLSRTMKPKRFIARPSNHQRFK